MNIQFSKAIKTHTKQEQENTLNEDISIAKPYDHLCKLLNQVHPNEMLYKPIEGAACTFYKKTNNKFGKFLSLKKKFVNPGVILEEIKQKQDFSSRMKVMLTKERDYTPLQSSSKTVIKEFDGKKISSSTKFSSEGFKSPRAIALIPYKDKASIVDGRKFNDNSTSDNIMQQSNDNTKMCFSFNSSMRENEVKASTEKPKSFNKTARFYKAACMEQMKLSEMNTLLSKNKYPNDNFIMYNITNSLCEIFPETFEKIKHYFKMNTSLLNSDNKQIQMFVVCLDVLIDEFKDIITGERKEERCLNCMTLLDSIYLDFCLHVNQNSNYRCEFLKKIWVKRIELMEMFISQLKKTIAQQSGYIEKLSQENETLAEAVKQIKEDKEEIHVNLKVKQRENETWMKMMIEKDIREKELQEKLTQLTKLYDEQTLAYNDIKKKFSARFNLNTRKSIFEDVYTRHIQQDKFNSNSPIIDKGLCIQEEEEEDIPIQPIQLDLKDLLQSRQERGMKTADKTKSSLKTRIALSKEVRAPEKRNSLLNCGILSIDRDIRHEILTALTSKNQFDLYINKGMNLRYINRQDQDTQTDIRGVHLDSVVDQGILANLNTSLEQMGFHFETLKDNISEGSTEQKEMVKIIQDKFKGLSEELKKIIDESDLVYKENDIMKERIDSLNEQCEKTQEMYMEIFNTFLTCIQESNGELTKFLSNNADKLTKGKLGNEMTRVLLSISNRNQVTVEKSTVSPIYKYLAKPLLEVPSVTVAESNSNLKRNVELYRRSSKTMKSIRDFTISFKNVLMEFLDNKDKIKSNLSLKNTQKIINTMYFEILEKAFFKADPLNFDKEEKIIDLGEVVKVYFIQNYGLDLLAKKKCLEFLQALVQYESTSKRVYIFSKLLQIHKERTEIPTQRRRTSIKHLTSIVQNPIKYNKELSQFLLPVQYFDVFVSRQLFLFIQSLKVNSHVLKVTDDTHSGSVYIINNKLYDLIIQLYSKYSLSDAMKTKLSAFLEKSKHSYVKNMKTYTVVDFDDLMECVSEILIEVKSVFSSIVAIIYNALDIEGNGEMTLFEFLILNQYLFRHSLSYSEIMAIFESYSSEDILTYEMFESLMIESDILDVGYYRNYLRMTDDKENIVVVKCFRELSQDSSVTALDNIFKRLHAVQWSNLYDLLVKKAQALMSKAAHSSLEKPEEYTTLWLSFRLFDDVSLNLYNESKLSKVFHELDNIYKELETATETKITEDYVTQYIKTLR